MGNSRLCLFFLVVLILAGVFKIGQASIEVAVYRDMAGAVKIAKKTCIPWDNNKINYYQLPVGMSIDDLYRQIIWR